MSNNHEHYDLIIPQIKFVGEFIVNENNVVISLTGKIITDTVVSETTGELIDRGIVSPVTLLPTQTFPQGPTYVPNDNIFNKDPNFTYNGLAFTTTTGTGELIYWTLYSGLNETDSTKMNYVDYGSDVTDLTNNTVQSSFIIRKKNNPPVLFLSDVDRLIVKDAGLVTYKITISDFLLNAILFVEDGIVIHIRGTIGNNAITLLNPGVYPSIDQPNDNKFDGKFTELGMSFATSEGLSVVYYNLYSGRFSNIMYTGFDITGVNSIYEDVKVCVDSSGYYCEN